ncbi:MAG: prolipoprotein diacylglyceryl transferase, partial [Anaerolineaceae bacterium]|nr:prolipoprotein diacylglyceryl transferase [Anaerolineaceae bacterium]
PWAITIDPEYRLPEFSMFSTYHPLFLYECIWNLLNMGLLLYLSRRLVNWLKSGDIFLVYLMMYGVGRFLLEFLRLDSAQVAGINANQTVAVVVALAAAGFLLWRHGKFAPGAKPKTATKTKAAAAGKIEVDMAQAKTTKKVAAAKADEADLKKTVKKPAQKSPQSTAAQTVKTTKTKSTKSK